MVDMLFDKSLTNLINFVKNMNDSDKAKLKDMCEKISKLDDQNKMILFGLLYEDFNKEFDRVIKNNQLCKKANTKQGAKSLKKK